MKKDHRPAPPVQLPQHEGAPAAWQEALVHLPAFAFVCCFAAILLLTLLVYLPSTGHGFVMDDHGQIVDNAKIQTSGNVLGYFQEDVWEGHPNGSSNYYRPLFLVWLRLHFLLYGLSPAGWHFSSILAQVIVTLLLGLLTWKLLHDRAACLLAMAFFALHPAHVESISYVSAVPDPLMSAAILVSVLLLLQWTKLPQEDASAKSLRQPKVKSRFARKSVESLSANMPQGSAAWLVASVLCYAAALLCKEPAVLFPLLVLAVAGLGHEHKKRWLRAALVTLPYAVVAAGYLLVRKLVLHSVTGDTLSEIPLTTFVLSLPATAWFYIKALFFPFHNVAFANSPLTSQFTLAGVFLPLAGVLLFVSALIALTRWMLRRPLEQNTESHLRVALCIAWLFLALPLLPTLNLRALIADDLLHGRYDYLPTAGLALLLACAWHRLQNLRLKSVLLAASAVLLLIFAGVTAVQEKAWKSDLTAWVAGYRVAPNNAIVLDHLSAELVRARLIPQTVPVAQNWTHAAPQNWRAWAVLAECYMKLGRYADAEAPINRAAQLNPTDARVQMERQMVNTRLGH